MMRSWRIAALLVCAGSLWGQGAGTAPAKGCVLKEQSYASTEEARQEADRIFDEAAKLYDEKTGEASRKAIERFEKAASAYAFAGDKKSQAEAITRAGLVHSDLGENTQSLDCLTAALPLRQTIHDFGGEARTRNSLGSVYSDMGQRQEALKYYNQALRIFRTIGDRPGEAITLNNIGATYDDLGARVKSLAYYRRSLALRRAVRDRIGEARTLNNIGLVYAAMGQNRRALEYYNQSLPLSRAVQDRPSEAAALTNIGLAYDDLGEREKALDYYEKVLAINRDMGDAEGEATTLDNIAEIYGALGQKQQALEMHRQALPIWKSIKNLAGEATTLSSMGRIYGELGQQDRALDFYNRALPMRRAAGDRPGEGITLNNMGRAYEAMGQVDEALKYYNLALPIRREVSDRTGEGITLDNIGRVKAATGDTQEALSDYTRALTLERQVEDREHQALTLGDLMRLLRKSDPDLAIVFGKQSVNTLQSLRRDISGLNKELQQSFSKSNENTYRQLAELLISRERYWEAQRVLDLLKDEEYFQFIERGAPVARTGPIALGPKDAQPLAAIEEERRKLLAKEQLTPEEEQRKEQLDGLRNAASVGVGKFFNQMARVRFRRDPKLNSITVKDYEQRLAADLEDVLEDNTAVIYTLVAEDSFHALLITSKFKQAWSYKITARELSDKVFAFHQALACPNTRPKCNTPDPIPLANELYKIVVGDLGRELETAHINTILWSLDEMLRYIPMAALYDGQHYLAERYRNVVYTKYGDVNGTFHAGKVLAAGVSQERGALPALDSVPGELRAVVNTGPEPGKMLLDDDFTTKAFRASLYGEYAVIHIASHFVFKPGGVDDSYLLTGDGKLTLKQLETGDYSFKGIQLLTLSACDTAAGATGDGREVDGLGFLADHKHARAVVATLWHVNDKSTAAFMKAFYQELGHTAGITKAEALQRAQLTLLCGDTKVCGGSGGAERSRDEDFSHPYFWAPFILIGNGN